MELKDVLLRSSLSVSCVRTGRGSGLTPMDLSFGLRRSLWCVPEYDCKKNSEGQLLFDICLLLKRDEMPIPSI